MKTFYTEGHFQARKEWCRVLMSVFRNGRMKEKKSHGILSNKNMDKKMLGWNMPGLLSRVRENTELRLL